MSGPIYVIGHKHSDLDSVASAYGYARLLQLQGEAQPVAARQGALRPEVRFVLERFHVDPPQEMEDVYLRVCDVMQRQVLSISLDQPLLEAGRLLQEYHRLSLPIVDAGNKVRGILATEDFAQLFFRGLDLHSVNRLPLWRDSLSSARNRSCHYSKRSWLPSRERRVPRSRDHSGETGCQ